MIKNSQAHLNEVKETYLKHMAVNFKIGLSTILAGFKFMIHGIIPALLKKNDMANNTDFKLYELK